MKTVPGGFAFFRHTTHEMHINIRPRRLTRLEHMIVAFSAAPPRYRARFPHPSMDLSVWLCDRRPRGLYRNMPIFRRPLIHPYRNCQSSPPESTKIASQPAWLLRREYRHTWLNYWQSSMLLSPRLPCSRCHLCRPSAAAGKFLSMLCAHRIDFFTAGKVEQDNLKSRTDMFVKQSKTKWDFDEFENRVSSATTGAVVKRKAWSQFRWQKF